MPLGRLLETNVSIANEFPFCWRGEQSDGVGSGSYLFLVQYCERGAVFGLRIQQVCLKRLELFEMNRSLSLLQEQLRTACFIMIECILVGFGVLLHLSRRSGMNQHGAFIVVVIVFAMPYAAAYQVSVLQQQASRDQRENDQTEASTRLL